MKEEKVCTTSHIGSSIGVMRGVITVEASLVMPIVLSVFVLAMYAGISLYASVRDTARAIVREQSADIVNEFYQYKGLEGLLQGED
jgi:hypothetical protein